MSWLYSQVLVAEYSPASYSAGAPSALSSGTLTQPVFSSADRTTAFSRRSLSGMTFKLLTESHGADVLKSYLAAFPARTFPPQEKAQASMASEAECGHTWRELSAKFCPLTSSWRTHHCLWEEDLPESSVTLPRWGMMRSGVLSERITLPHLTSATESGSSLPTPTCAAAIQGVNQPDGKRGQTLLGAAKKQSWPTPCATDYKGSGKTGQLRDRLDYAVERGATKSHVYSPPTDQQGQLNPTWVELLMGWPPGWTDLTPMPLTTYQAWHTAFTKNNTSHTPAQKAWQDGTWEKNTPRTTQKTHARVNRLKCCGNGQVPLTATTAIHHLRKLTQ